MYLVVVGDFEREEMIVQLENTFGSWVPEYEESWGASFREFLYKLAGRDNVVRGNGLEVPAHENPSSAELSGFLPHDQVAIGFARITTTSEEDDYLGLGLLEDVLDQRLFNIRIQTGLFYSVQSWLSAGASRRLNGFAGVGTEVTLANVEAARACIIEVLNDVSTNGITAEELKASKDTAANDFATSFHTNDSLCGAYASCLTSSEEFERYNTRAARLQEFTLEEINDIARRYLDPATWSSCTVGRVGEPEA